MASVTVRGVEVPAVGFGTWQLTGRQAYRSVRHALEVGYRHIDTARMYDNEEQIGRALADSPVDRGEVFVTTKIWRRQARPADVVTSHERSLRRLGTDHVDLLLLHWPSDLAPLEATLEAMDRLRREGRTRLIGVSNHTAAQLERAADAAPVACNQVEYHALLDQAPVLEAVRDRDMFLAAYCPLAQGALVDHPTLARIGKRHDRSPAQVALRWLVRQEGVVPLPRSGTPAHIEENLAVHDFTLAPSEIEAIERLPKDHRVVDPPFAPDWD